MGQSQFNICKKTEQQPDIDSRIEQGLDIIDQQRAHLNYLNLDAIDNQPEFNFQYFEGHPQTLTMTKRCKDILKLMYQVPTYIWIDPNMQQNIPDVKYIEQHVKCTLIYLKTVEDAEQLLGMHTNYMVICSLKVAEKVQSSLSSHSTIKGIACYCKDTKTYNKLKQQSKLGKKFMFCTDKIAQIVTYLKQNRHYTYCYKQHPNFISMKDETWNSNTLVETIMSMLSVQTNRLQLIQQLCKIGKMMGKKQQVQQFHNKAVDKQFGAEQAIKWYTKDTFLYSLINTLLRSSRHICQMYVLQPFVKDLFNGIKQIHKKQEGIQKYNNFTCYRGGMISQAEVQYFRKNTGCIVQNLGFLSTTIKYDIAKKFLMKPYNNAIFTIKVSKIKQQVYDNGYAWVAQLSDQSKQQQILFNPLSSFRVMNIKSSIQRGKDCYVIELQYGVLSKLMQIKQQELSNVDRNYRYLAEYQRAYIKKIVRFGDVLQWRSKDNHQFFGKYIQKLISLIDNQQGHDIYNLYHLGELEFRQNKFNAAIEYFNKSQQEYKSKYKWGGHMHRQIWERIADSYNHLNQLEKAVEIYEKVLHYLNNQERTTEIQMSRASMFQKIGDTWIILKQQIRGLACIGESLKIVKQIYGQYSILYAKRLTNLGMAYNECIQHPDSKEYFLQKAESALKESERIIKILQDQENLDYIQTINALGLVQTKRGNYNQANKLFTKVQNIYSKLNIKNVDFQIAYLINFGHNYAASGDYEKGLQYLDKALQSIKLNSPQSDYTQDKHYKKIAQVRNNLQQKIKYNKQ